MRCLAMVSSINNETRRNRLRRALKLDSSTLPLPGPSLIHPFCPLTGDLRNSRAPHSALQCSAIFQFLAWIYVVY